ncbi:MAG: zinc-dependent peptidase [Pirellulaceae bacterium]|nr:zinc-dependent peptidase [Pirellulaceae bacterium]
MFGWWTRARRRRLIAKPAASNMRQYLSANLWQWSYLPDDVTERALDWLRIFAHEKYWEGCGGFDLKPHHPWLVAGQASLMTLAFPEWFFDGCRTLLIYPGDYVAPGITHMVNGQIGIHGDQPRSGQTSYRGPVILNWTAIYEAGRSSNDGHSLTVHELAHQLDFDNGPNSDGVPPLPKHVNAEQWQRDFQMQLDELRDRARIGYTGLVNDYGLTSSSELFAVSSELFFQLPHELAEHHPELCDLLLACYQLDWREWIV